MPTKLQEERQARARGRAERLEDLAASQSEAAMSEVKHLPLGQPVLAGHHSEKRHRRMLDRRNRLMDRSLETSQKARRAKSAALHAGKAVLGRDPEAVEELTRQLEAAEMERERIKALNKAFRRGVKKGGKGGGFEEVKAWFQTDEAGAFDVNALSALMAEGCQTMRLTPQESVPFPAYRLTNLGANIRRLKSRIEELRAKREREAVVLEEEWGTYEEDPEADRLRLKFSRRLTKDEFKSVLLAGFRWSRQLETFQRHLNDGGRWAAQRIVERLAGVRLVFKDGAVSAGAAGKRPSEPCPSWEIAASWLDDDGRLKLGKFYGRLAADVVAEHPRYVEWILSDTEIDDEDARILRTLLDRRPRCES